MRYLFLKSKYFWRKLVLASGDEVFRQPESLGRGFTFNVPSEPQKLSDMNITSSLAHPLGDRDKGYFC